VTLHAVDLTGCSQRVNVAEFCRGRRVVIVGCPGAFAPVCSNVQVSGFLARQQELYAKGVSAVLVYSVAEGHVMTAWAKVQGIFGTLIHFMADPGAHFTRALGVDLTEDSLHMPVSSVRTKRCAMIVQDGLVWRIQVASYSDDPAGELHPHIACVDKVLRDLETLSCVMPAPSSDSLKGVALNVNAKSRLAHITHRSIASASTCSGPSTPSSPGASP